MKNLFSYKALMLSATIVFPFLGMPSYVYAGPYWVNANAGTIPSGALAAGKEHPPGKQTLYVCQAKFNGGVHPGKVRPAFGGCNIGWGGGEHAVRDYKVLLNKPGFIWIPASNGHIPKSAVKGGVEHPPGKQALFVCRANFNGGIHPGKVRPAFGACNIGWGGKEHAVKNYEVLVNAPDKWVNANGGHIPTYALKGGQEHPPGKQKLFVCRAEFNGGVHSGKVRPAFGACNIGWGGKEHAVRSYQVLLNNPYFKWVPASGGAIPAKAVRSGQEHPPGKQALFVCRAKFNGGVHPGKVRPAFGGCNIGWGGQEHAVRNYEVLVK